MVGKNGYVVNVTKSRHCQQRGRIPFLKPWDIPFWLHSNGVFNDETSSKPWLEGMVRCTLWLTTDWLFAEATRTLRRRKLGVMVIYMGTSAVSRWADKHSSLLYSASTQMVFILPISLCHRRTYTHSQSKPGQVKWSWYKTTLYTHHTYLHTISIFNLREKAKMQLQFLFYSLRRCMTILQSKTSSDNIRV